MAEVAFMRAQETARERAHRLMQEANEAAEALHAEAIAAFQAAVEAAEAALTVGGHVGVRQQLRTMAEHTRSALETLRAIRGRK